MDLFKEMLQGLYDFMLKIQVPVFGQFFSLWIIFLFGAFGGLVVWFLKKFFS